MLHSTRDPISFIVPLQKWRVTSSEDSSGLKSLMKVHWLPMIWSKESSPTITLDWDPGFKERNTKRWKESWKEMIIIKFKLLKKNPRLVAI